MPPVRIELRIPSLEGQGTRAQEAYNSFAVVVLEVGVENTEHIENTEVPDSKDGQKSQKR
jgi:hypothetical protein